MTNEEQLRMKREQLLRELEECDNRLNSIKSQKDKEAEIKRNYHMNQVETEYNIDYMLYSKILEKAMFEAVKDEPDKVKELQDRLDVLQKGISTVVSPDPSKLWNCPKCGESNALYVGDHSPDGFTTRHAVTCSNCDFIGPMTRDYGEAWTEFIEWLSKEGYLND